MPDMQNTPEYWEKELKAKLTGLEMGVSETRAQSVPKTHIPAVPGQLEILGKNIAKLEDKLNILHERLQPVMIERPLNQGPQDGKGLQPRLAGILRERSDSIEFLTNRVIDMIDGLEI